MSQRAQEFGVRMALGARPLDIVWMMARESVRLAAPGLLMGGAAALLVFRGVGGMLVGVDPADPLIIGAAATSLFAVTLLAAYGPARRAGRVDPMGGARSR